MRSLKFRAGEPGRTQAQAGRSVRGHHQAEHHQQDQRKGRAFFVLELEYAGVFEVQGVPEEQMHPYLLIECPRITFPFLRGSSAM